MGAKTRDSLLFDGKGISDPNEKKEKDERVTRFITTFSRVFNSLRIIIYSHWKVLRIDTVISNSMGRNVMISYRKSRSLDDTLVHSDLKARETRMWLLSLRGFRPCKRCKACKTSKNVSHYVTAWGKQKLIIEFLYCNTDFCIYVLTCPCARKYVGSTIFQIGRASCRKECRL